MTREEITKQVLTSKKNSIVLELGTGVGKTRLAIEKLKQWRPATTLVVVPRNVLKKTWLSEAEKWGCDVLFDTVTYASLSNEREYDTVIFDEAHHLTDRCRKIVPKARHYMFLTATMSREIGMWICTHFDPEIVYCNTRMSIDSQILPEPTVYLYPLRLNMVVSKPIYWHWKCYHASQQAVYNKIEEDIRAASNDEWKLKLLRIERLKWLAEQKMDIVKDMITLLKGRRLICFCNTIEQTEKLGCLGCYEINSKSKMAQENLEQFNRHKVEHISACNMLDEGVNLEDCEIAIFASLSSSMKLQAQRIGRALRHPHPKLIIPYYKFTRENAIANKMCENFKDIQFREYDNDTKHEEAERTLLG